MTAAYWNQWDYDELASMLGKDIPYHDDDQDDTITLMGNVDKASEAQVCCSGCMDCLGLTW